MPKSNFNTNQPNHPEAEFQADWKAGPRTMAWDQLWRRILEDVSHGQDHPVIDAVEEPGRE